MLRRVLEYLSLASRYLILTYAVRALKKEAAIRAGHWCLGVFGDVCKPSLVGNGKPGAVLQSREHTH